MTFALGQLVAMSEDSAKHTIEVSEVGLRAWQLYLLKEVIPQRSFEMICY